MNKIKLVVGDKVIIVQATLAWGNSPEYTKAYDDRTLVTVTHVADVESKVSFGPFAGKKYKVIRTNAADYWSIGACDVEFVGKRKAPRQLKSWIMETGA